MISHPGGTEAELLERRAANAIAEPGRAAVRADPEREMAAFDALPRALRDALNGAPDEGWSAVDVLARWTRAARLYGTEAATAAALRRIREGGRRGEAGRGGATC